MPFYTVYHDNNPRFGFNEVERVFPVDFTKVALVDVSSIEQAFAVTNHIDSSWTESAEIYECYQEMPRSSSVGDVIVDDKGIAFLCLPMGWKSLGKVDDKYTINKFFALEKK